MRDNGDLGIVERLMLAAGPVGWLLAVAAVAAFWGVYEISRAVHVLNAIQR